MWEELREITSYWSTAKVFVIFTEKVCNSDLLVIIDIICTNSLLLTNSCYGFKCEKKTFLNSNRHLHPEKEICEKRLTCPVNRNSEMLRRRKNSSKCHWIKLLCKFSVFIFQKSPKTSPGSENSIAKARIIRLKEPLVLSWRIIVAIYWII